MPREKRTNVKRLPPIDLDMNNPQQARLWSFYQTKTTSGQGASWIVESLLLALPAQSNKQVVKPQSESRYVDIEE